MRKRAQLLLDHLEKIDIPDAIEDRLDVQVSRLKGMIEQISERLSDPVLTNPKYVDQNLYKLQEWNKVVDELESIYLPLVESWGPDSYAIQDFLERICREANLGPTIRLVVALYSSNYFTVEENLHIIYLPRMEGHFLLHLPDIYHELGHIILDYKAEVVWQDFKKRIQEYFDREYQRAKLVLKISTSSK